MKKSKLIVLIACLTYGHIDQLKAGDQQSSITNISSAVFNTLGPMGASMVIGAGTGLTIAAIQSLYRKYMAARQNKPVEIKVEETFASVAGFSQAKASLQYIVDFLKNPQKHGRLGAKIPRGVLLVGGPGNGKTLLARAVAGEANCTFFNVAGSELIGEYIGEGAEKIRNIFSAARKYAPSIIFIDEIDAVGAKRSESSTHNNDQFYAIILNQLLAEMDGFVKSDKPVIVIATTNRLKSLDPALLRPGRFDRIIEVRNPDLKGREEILRLHASKVVMSPHIDFIKLAQMTENFSAAQIANLINEATILASSADKDMVEQEDLEAALHLMQQPIG